MNLIINNELFEGKAKEFANWLIPVFQDVLKNSINKDKLINWDNYLNSERVSKRLGFNRKMSTLSILLAGSYNLKVVTNNVESRIEIDSNSIIPNSNAKFINILKLINYGNLSLSGYPIYEDTFNLLADNADELFNEFKEAEN